MVQQVIDTTTLQPNGKQGEPIRTAFNKANANFDELYDVFGELGTAAQGDLQKLSTDYFGPEPTITWPGMTWGDEANGLEKRRNSANNAWVTIGPLFDYRYTRGNILSALSQSSGVPTGGLWQVSSATTGTVFRNASGQQICIFRADNFATRPIDRTRGNIFDSTNLVTWPYPAAFSEPPEVDAFSLSTARWMTAGIPGLTQCDFRIYSYMLDAASIGHQFKATGRWF